MVGLRILCTCQSLIECHWCEQICKSHSGASLRDSGCGVHVEFLEFFIHFLIIRLVKAQHRAFSGHEQSVCACGIIPSAMLYAVIRLSLELEVMSPQKVHPCAGRVWWCCLLLHFSFRWALFINNYGTWKFCLTQIIIWVGKNYLKCFSKFSISCITMEK